MATKEPTQKAKLSLKAIPLSLTRDIPNDYYLQPKLQKCLNLTDLAREVAALSTRQEDEEEVARIGKLLMERMMWFLSAGYSVSTPMGYFRLVAQGVVLENELNSAPDRSRLQLGVSYTMSEAMRKALDEAEIDVEIQKSANEPQLFAAVSAQDAQNPAAAARGEGTPIKGGQTVIIKGKNIKVGGEDEQVGITITRQDDHSQTTHFFPTNRLYPNTKSQVGFVLPADAPDGSVWDVKLCTQLSSNGTSLLKEMRTGTLPEPFVVGEVSSGGDDEDEEDERPGGL